MLKIRLMRIGAKQKPFFRVVAVDERAKRTGGYIELLGTYNPLTEPKDIKLKQDRIDYWVKKGAQLSTGFLRIIGKAPQRLPRKPKKEKAEEPKEAPKEKVEEAEEKTEEIVPEEKVEEAPKEQESVNEPVEEAGTKEAEPAEEEPAKEVPSEGDKDERPA